MNVLDRLLLRVARSRGFIVGPGVVDRSEMTYGHDDSQFSPPTYGEYLATSNGVYACATLRAELLSSLPLKAYRLKANGDKAEIKNGPLVELLQKVNPFWTFNRLISMTELSLCSWGECFWFLERGKSAVLPPREIWWARPDRVSVIPDPVNYIKGFLYHPTTGGQPIPFSPAETIWLRYPNPLDEYSGLAPLAAARIAADYSTSAMRANKLLFDQGMQAGGFVQPKAGTVLSPEQAQELELQFDRRFKGMDKAHRWGILRFEAQIQPNAISAREAEFLGGMRWSLEDICRAFRVPLDLIGGQRTYENTDAAYRGVWTNAILPEARFIATELTEQLLPMFLAQADLLAFDSSGVSVLQEAEAQRWTRAKEQISAGALTINEWREESGQTALDWGNVWWAPANLIAIDAAPSSDAALPELPPVEGSPEEAADELAAGKAEGKGPGAEKPPRGRGQRQIAYGSDEHARLWRRFDRRVQAQEKAVKRVVADLFTRQRDSILARLRSRSKRAPVADNPFDKPEWVKKFRVAIRPVINATVADAGETALDDLSGISISFDVHDPNVVRYIERRAQRFAVEVNETTYDALRTSLQEGVTAGESIPDLAQRVTDVMGTRITSDATTIARTEVVSAENAGTLLSWQQSGVVSGKTWLATLDDRTRDTHQEAHGQQVGLDEDFQVGDASGPAPGQMGDPAEDINCRCSIVAVLN